MEVDESTALAEKNAQIVSIFKLTDLVLSLLPPSSKANYKPDGTPAKIDIDLSDKISGVVATVFTLLRRSNQKADLDNKYSTFQAKIDDTVLNIKDIAEQAKTEGIEFNFIIATPIMNLLTAYKCFFDEVRTGVTKFPIRVDAAKEIKRARMGLQNVQGMTLTEEERMTSITIYGLNNQHIPLLQGITLPPERKTGLLRSIGPLAQCIQLIHENRYPAKLSASIENSLQMLPMKREIASLLRDVNSPGRVQGLMKELGDLLILTTGRSTQKIYMPLLFAKFLWAARPNICPGISWNFGSSAMLALISSAIKMRKVVFTMKSGANNTLIRQVVFHAMFGTYLEDLGVLQQITDNGDWKTRKELTAIFHKRGTEGHRVEFTPIIFVKFSKMAQSLLTKNLGNIEPCLTTRPSFNGNRKRSFSAALSSYYQSGKMLSNYSTDPLQLQIAVRQMRDDVLKKQGTPEFLELGTKKWMVINSEGALIDDDIVVEESGVSFYS